MHKKRNISHYKTLRIIISVNLFITWLIPKNKTVKRGEILNWKRVRPSEKKVFPSNKKFIYKPAGRCLSEIGNIFHCITVYVTYGEFIQLVRIFYQKDHFMNKYETKL